MKIILSYSEEYNDICVVEVLPDGTDALAAFRRHAVERAQELLGIPEEEALKAVEDGGDDDFMYYEYEGSAAATISMSNGCEILQLKDIPMPEGTDAPSDPYKAGILAKHQKAMDGDEYYFAQVAGPAGAPINLDREALELLKEYYSGNLRK